MRRICWVSLGVSALSLLVSGSPPSSGLANVSIACLCGNEYGAIELSYQHPQAAAVIAVLVREQNAVERIRVFTEQGHAAHDFTRAHSGINQNTRAVGDQQHCVASRTATEYRDFHEKT